jgi:hypothetical protein
MTEPEPTPDLEWETGYELLYPFIVCKTHGGPYDDDTFVAGVQVGWVDRTLATAAALGITPVAFTARTVLLKQLELVGMAHDFPVMEMEDTDIHEWTLVTFYRERPTVGTDL